MPDNELSRENFKFHCPKDGELVTVNDNCFDCKEKSCCDIYASMLDEYVH